MCHIVKKPVLNTYRNASQRNINTLDCLSCFQRPPDLQTGYEEKIYNPLFFHILLIVHLLLLIQLFLKSDLFSIFINFLKSIRVPSTHEDKKSIKSTSAQPSSITIVQYHTCQDCSILMNKIRGILRCAIYKQDK